MEVAGVRAPSGPSGPSDRPGGAGGEQLAQLARALALLGAEELVLDERAVVRPLHVPEHADGGRLVRAAGEAAQHEGEVRVLPVLVVDQQRVLTGFGDQDDAGPALRVEHDTLLAVR